MSTEPSPVIIKNRKMVARFYPSWSKQRGEEGDVYFAMKTAPDGKGDSCQVTKSSGYLRLDQATCDLMLAGTTADPLVDAAGKRVTGMRTGFVP